MVTSMVIRLLHMIGVSDALNRIKFVTFILNLIINSNYRHKAAVSIFNYLTLSLCVFSPFSLALSFPSPIIFVMMLQQQQSFAHHRQCSRPKSFPSLLYQSLLPRFFLSFFFSNSTKKSSSIHVIIFYFSFHSNRVK